MPGLSYGWKGAVSVDIKGSMTHVRLYSPYTWLVMPLSLNLIVHMHKQLLKASAGDRRQTLSSATQWRTGLCSNCTRWTSGGRHRKLRDARIDPMTMVTERNVARIVVLGAKGVGKTGQSLSHFIWLHEFHAQYHLGFVRFCHGTFRYF